MNVTRVIPCEGPDEEARRGALKATREREMEPGALRLALPLVPRGPAGQRASAGGLQRHIMCANL